VKGFSHSTITLHKSVVATFANPDRSAALSSHPIIRLKGSFASEVRPENHYLGCPAVRILAGTKSAEPNLFQVSRHVACLLLLASGRRVHDLTLLSTAEDLFQDLGEVLVFRPRLWSKTNSGSHQQSGWRLSGMTSSPSLDVVRWVRRLLLSKTRGRSLAEAPLFVTTRGKVAPASRTIIAGWVSSALSAAGISAPPGSVRAAIGSSYAAAGLPLDDILRMGNWRQRGTFFALYYRPIERRPTRPSSLVASSSVPV